MKLTEKEKQELESLLLRVRAAAKSERSKWQRLYGSYGGRRASVDSSLAASERTIEQATYFIEKLHEPTSG